MKTIYKLMGILSVFVNTSCAVDAVVLMTSKGCVPYALIGESETLPQNAPSRLLSIPMLQNSSDASLDTMEILAHEEDYSGITPYVKEVPGASKPIPIIYAEQEKAPDEGEEDLLPHSLTQSFAYRHGRLNRKASLLEFPVGSGGQSDSGALASSEQDEILLRHNMVICHGFSDPEEKKDEEEDDLKKSFSSLSAMHAMLSRTASFTHPISALSGGESNVAIPCKSVSSFDEIDFFESDGFQSVADSSNAEGSVALNSSLVMSASRWIPGENVTVAFARNNHKVAVVWGRKFEQHEEVCSLKQANPTRYKPPLTPINTVPRPSVNVPGSRTLDARLREAMVNCLLPIQFEVHPRTGEEIIKIKPRSESPIIILISEIET